MTEPTKKHVFWCQRGYQPLADCTCTGPLLECGRCGHLEDRHFPDTGYCRMVSCHCLGFRAHRRIADLLRWSAA
jgi:hypothetical protein